MFIPPVYYKIYIAIMLSDEEPIRYSAELDKQAKISDSELGLFEIEVQLQNALVENRFEA
jgi:hypothetical protein